MVSSLYRTLLEEDVVAANPVLGIRMAQPDRKPRRSLTPEDFRRIVVHLPTEGLALFAKVLVGTGMRFGEAAALTGEDFDPATGEISINKRLVKASTKATGAGGYIVMPSTKSGRSRVVPLSKALAEEVNAWVRPGILFSVERCLHVPPQAGEVWNGQLRHGTLPSYDAGCRCPLCNQAYTYSLRRGSGHNTHKRWEHSWREALTSQLALHLHTRPPKVITATPRVLGRTPGGLCTLRNYAGRLELRVGRGRNAGSGASDPGRCAYQGPLARQGVAR